MWVISAESVVLEAPVDPRGTNFTQMVFGGKDSSVGLISSSDSSHYISYLQVIVLAQGPGHVASG